MFSFADYVKGTVPAPVKKENIGAMPVYKLKDEVLGKLLFVDAEKYDWSGPKFDCYSWLPVVDISTMKIVDIVASDSTYFGYSFHYSLKIEPSNFLQVGQIKAYMVKSTASKELVGMMSFIETKDALYGKPLCEAAKCDWEGGSYVWYPVIDAQRRIVDIIVKEHAERGDKSFHYNKRIEPSSITGVYQEVQ
jgi:hypothetical protein